jgi:hypothetical protein
MEAIIAGAIAVFILLSPFINAGIQNVTWTPKQKALLAWGVSIVLALAFLFVTGGVSALTNIFIAAPTVYGYQQAIYTFLIKNIATKFEAITTPGSIVVSPSSVTPGTVDITSDVTQANPTGHQLEVDPPVSVVTGTTPAAEAPSEPAKPVEITKEDNVVG